MSAASFVILLPLLWLGWRVVQLWSTPLTLVLRHLQIEIPSPPRITIDALTADSVSLHWAPPEPYVRKHIIQMDGQEVGVSLRGETSVTISGLTADYLYSIQVIAVNVQGFQVASPAVYVRTRPKSENESEEVETQEINEPHVQSHSHSTEVSSIAHRQPKKRASVDVLKTKDPMDGSDDASRAVSSGLIDGLRSQMDTIIKETSDVEAQLSQLADHQAQEEASYAAKLEDLRAKKKEEDDIRTAKDQHHKQLDQQKREIETKRNQVQRALKAEQDAYRRQANDIKSFALSVTSSIETVEHLEESIKGLKTETDEAVREAERTAAIAAEELSEIESEIRYLLSRKAESEADLAKLLAESRVPSPSPQEVSENAQIDALWKQREESLAKQYNDVHQKLLRLQNNAYFMQEGRNNGTPGSDPGLEYTTQMRRRVSRRGRADEIGRPESAARGAAFPTFNPDAPPFVASSPLYSGSTEPSPQGMVQTSQSSFGPGDYQVPAAAFPIHQEAPGFAAPRASYMPGTTSIFNDETLHPHIATPFARRESPKSSQSGSNPPSPAVQTRGGLPSIFNAAPGIVQRSSSGSLVSSLKGTPIVETPEGPSGPDSSKWFWPVKKVKADPLALDRSNARSLPKADVAPIGTRRNRSGSLREDNNNARSSAPPTANGYHDLDLSNVIGQPLSREASHDREAYSTTAFPLPRPSDGRAFGWDSPQIPSSQRHLPNPWNATDIDAGTSSSRAFDPFGDMPSHSTQLNSLNEDFLTPPSSFHTTIDPARLHGLDRELSNGSRKSAKSKGENQDPKSKTKRLSDTGKFGSFVGRIFNRDKEEREAAHGAGEEARDSLETNGISSD